MNRPWIKFYPRDWRADPRLRMCSLAARGLWAEMIGYMHEAEPYGHMLIDGKPPSPEDIAALVGRPASETRKAIDELGARGVYSTTTTGVIFSRRMVRDEERSTAGQESAGRRWANGSPNGTPNRSPIGSPIPKPGDLPNAHCQIPETRKEEDTAGAVSKYEFEEGVIRLSKKDFLNWKAAFQHIDLAAELIGLSDWAAQQERWFHALKGALAKKNREAKMAFDKAKSEPGFKWNGIEGVL